MMIIDLYLPLTWSFEWLFPIVDKVLKQMKWNIISCLFSLKNRRIFLLFLIIERKNSARKLGFFNPIGFEIDNQRRKMKPITDSVRDKKIRFCCYCKGQFYFFVFSAGFLLLLLWFSLKEIEKHGMLNNLCEWKKKNLLFMNSKFHNLEALYEQEEINWESYKQPNICSFLFVWIPFRYIYNQ